MKSLYGSITRSAVISFSYVTFVMLPPGYAVTQVDQRVLLRWRCQRLSPCDRNAPRGFNPAYVGSGSWAVVTTTLAARPLYPDSCRLAALLLSAGSGHFRKTMDLSFFTLVALMAGHHSSV